MLAHIFKRQLILAIEQTGLPGSDETSAHLSQQSDACDAWWVAWYADLHSKGFYKLHVDKQKAKLEKLAAMMIAKQDAPKLAQLEADTHTSKFIARKLAQLEPDVHKRAELACAQLEADVHKRAKLEVEARKIARELAQLEAKPPPKVTTTEPKAPTAHNPKASAESAARKPKAPVARQPNA